MKPSNDQLETEYWYGWSTWLPEDWFIDTAPEIVTQFHTDSGVGGGPPLRVKIDGEKLVIANKHLIDGALTSTRLYKADVINAMKGRWTDFVLRAVWTTGNHGILEVWMNGSKLFRKFGSTTHTDLSGVHFKIGVYKGDWKKNNPDSILDSRVVYHDEVRLAQGANGRSLVDPATYGTGAPAP
ncbi:MAG: polysaccharide lyase [Pseudomonadota bacterium]|nr:polysaccharide lyase [Pseudomonadota bacterium]